MLSFNSQNYVVEYKKATPQQWRGEVPKDNKLERVFGLFREPDEVNAIGTAMDVVCNFYNGQCKRDYNLRQILFYNEYGELDGVFYDFQATPESEWSEQPEDAVTQTWWVENREDTIAFNHKNSFTLGSSLEIPVPDGYHYIQFGYGLNQGWSYIVPQDVSLHDNHIDAKPYSFGVTTSPVSHIAFESKDIEAYKQAFLSAGHLTPGVLVDSFTVSAHCAFLYQNWYDTEDKYYNKINGFLFAGNDVYQFHIYVNHTTPIGHDESTSSAFLEVGRAWMRQVSLKEDQENSTYIPIEKIGTQEPAPEGFEQVLKKDCKIEDKTTLVEYYGSAKRIILPRGIETIATDCFHNSNIEGIVIPKGVTVIENNAFQFCKNLKYVYLPSSLTDINDRAFRMCESLEEIVIPEGTTWIGTDAFKICDALRDIYIPSSVTFIGADAFQTFNEDTTIHTPRGSSAQNYAEEHDVKFDQRSAPQRAIPKATKKPASEKPAAKAGKTEDFVIEDGVLKEYKGNAEHLLLPEGIHTVGESAFQYNATLQSVVIPEGVHTIAKDAFNLCSNLEAVTLPSTLKYLGGFGHAKMKKLQIPNGVEVIGYRAFSGCNELRELILPQSVIKIEDMAFASCGKAKNIYIPESVTQIDDMACWHSGRTILHVHPGSYAEEFAKRHKVKFDNEIQVYLDTQEGKNQGTTKKKAATVKANSETVAVTTPAAPKEPFSLFASGKTLNKYKGKDTVVVVPDGVTEISPFAFSKTKVTAITLPDSVKKIGKYAFAHCSKLKQIRIPDSVTSVDNYAFYQCSSLTEIIWHGNIKTIPEKACHMCEALTKVVIEEGITEIGDSAFSFCPKLKDLHLPQSINKIGDHALLWSGSPTLHVYLDSYAEKYAKENNLPVKILLTPEQEVEQKRKQEEEERRKQEYEERCRREAEERARKAAEEAERRRKAAEEAERKRQAELAAKRAHYDELQKNISGQERIIADNRGWFGEQAKARKAAKEQLAILQAQLAREFPNGRP